MGYTEQYAVAQDVGYIGRVSIAAVTAAVAVNGEAASTPHAEERGKLAVYVLRDPVQWGRTLAFGCAADPTLDLNATDAALFARISAIWTDYAVAYTTTE